MIRVVTLAEFPEDALKLILRKLRLTFGVGAEFAKEASMVKAAYDPKADAYDAIRLVTDAERVPTFGDDKIVYLTDRVLKLPPGPLGVGPVDGFAQYGGVRAVATSAGLGSGKALPIAEGLAKRASRHAGHLFGLHHCYDVRCLMVPGWHDAFTTNPDAGLCVFCRDKVEKSQSRI